MKCRGWQALKANEKRGVSMVVMLCVSAFFIAFATAILYTAGLVTSQSTQRLKQERCYQLAKSYAQVLDKELTKYTNKNDETAIGGTFYKFANQFLDRSQYTEYDEDNDPENTQYTYFVSGTDLSDLAAENSSKSENGFGNLSITLRKIKNSDEDISNLGGSIQTTGDNSSYTEQIAQIRNYAVRQYSLSMDVTAYYEDVTTYTYTTEYAREESYEPKFTYNGVEIYWDTDSNTWKNGNSGGTDVALSSGGEIKYTFDTAQTTTSRFVNSQTGGAENGN